MDLPAAPVPSTADLRDFPYTPIFRARLFGSSFHARATDAEWRAGVTLWMKSWDQVPAGSLPDDDIDLCRLAELGRDMKAWKKIRSGALHGWFKCQGGRLYHKVVAEGVNEALDRKRQQREKTTKARLAALQKRLSEAKSGADRERITDEIRRLSLSLSQTPQPSVTEDAVRLSLTEESALTESKRREEKGREEKGLDISPSLRSGDPPLPPTGGGTAKPENHGWGKTPDGADETAWRDWTAYRRGKPKPQTIALSANFLRTLAPGDQREAVAQSIRNGWTGLFPVKRSPDAGARPRGGLTESAKNWGEEPEEEAHARV